MAGNRNLNSAGNVTRHSTGLLCNRLKKFKPFTALEQEPIRRRYYD